MLVDPDSAPPAAPCCPWGSGHLCGWILDGLGSQPGAVEFLAVQNFWVLVGGLGRDLVGARGVGVVGAIPYIQCPVIVIVHCLVVIHLVFRQSSCPLVVVVVLFVRHVVIVIFIVSLSSYRCSSRCHRRPSSSSSSNLHPRLSLSSPRCLVEYRLVSIFVFHRLRRVVSLVFTLVCLCYRLVVLSCIVSLNIFVIRRLRRVLSLVLIPIFPLLRWNSRWAVARLGAWLADHSVEFRLTPLSPVELRSVELRLTLFNSVELRLTPLNSVELDLTLLSSVELR